MDSELLAWVDANMTPLERIVVVFAAMCSPTEVHRLSGFFTDWDEEVARRAAPETLTPPAIRA